MTWSLETSNGFESRKIKYLLPKYTRGRVLEIGCGQEKAFPHFIGYDSGHHFGKGAADVVGDAASLSLFADESFDAVFSSHVLEHMVDMQAALNEWSRVIKPGGYLCLYVPSANLYPKCGEEGANPDHKHDIYATDIIDMLDESPYWFEQVEGEERSQGTEYSFFEVYKKLKAEDGSDAACLTILSLPPSPFTAVKTACVVRYGGFGDMLQAASILPALKKEGFHVTVMTTPEGQAIIRHDPNVDDWYLQDKDQVPNNELGAFWREQAKRFDRFINLSESIEGTLLAIPGRPNHGWPQEIRHKYLNRNYFDFTAELAGVEFKPCKQFYPTPLEQIDANKLINGTFTVLWSLSGSSHHKFTPHMDAVIARIMLEWPEAQVITVGDEACRILEGGWEDEPRVVCLSGKLAIRDTLALAQQADIVIGPETGVLNSVAHEPNAKVILLSHSSKKNLTQHWYNTTTLAPAGCSCYPCHRLHYSRDYCPGDEETGAAECMMKIGAADIWQALADTRKGKKK